MARRLIFFVEAGRRQSDVMSQAIFQVIHQYHMQMSNIRGMFGKGSHLTRRCATSGSFLSKKTPESPLLTHRSSQTCQLLSFVHVAQLWELLQALSPIFVSRSIQAEKLGTHQESLSKRPPVIQPGKSLPFGKSRVCAIKYAHASTGHQVSEPEHYLRAG